MIRREIENQLLHISKQFPVVTILGPRQSGKTTLAQSAFPAHEYINLELPNVRKAALDDPIGFFEIHNKPLILDEVQRAPELLSYIQAIVDENKTKGYFILTGSYQPRLAESISQSLAGRTGLLTLLPCTLTELREAGKQCTRDENIFNGFMPGIHFDGIEPNLFYSNYFQTYVERDVRMLINVSRQNRFETFVKLLAGRVGQVANLHSLASDVGVTSTTLASWLSVLEASFIVFRLPSYHNNFGKRLIKSPKIYFYEVGLAAWLLGIEKAEQVSRDPLIGGLFENLVVVEALKTRLNRGKQPNLYYFRDQRGLEIDLILEIGRHIYPIEIKSAMTYDKSFAKNLVEFCDVAENISDPTLIYAGEQEVKIGCVNFMNYRDVHRFVAAWSQS